MTRTVRGNDQRDQRARPACLPGAFGHLLTDVHGATALFPDMLLGEELVGGQVEGREGHRAWPVFFIPGWLTKALQMRSQTGRVKNEVRQKA